MNINRTFYFTNNITIVQVLFPHRNGISHLPTDHLIVTFFLISIKKPSVSNLHHFT